MDASNKAITWCGNQCSERLDDSLKVRAQPVVFSSAFLAFWPEFFPLFYIHACPVPSWLSWVMIEDRGKGLYQGWEGMKGQQHLLEQRPSELNAHILVTLHVEKVEGLLASQRPSSPWETLTIPHSELQLYVDMRSFLPSVDPIGAKPVVSVSTFLYGAVLIHVQRCPIQHLLPFTPLQEKNQTQWPELMKRELEPEFPG